MGIINHDLLSNHKKYRNNLNVNIDLYPLATELHDELEKLGIIARLKDIPQLGLIKVPRKFKKSRYDYVMLQLYLHKMIKNNLQNVLRLTYNNSVKAKEFRPEYNYNNKSDIPSIGDVLQILAIVYNIGHFYNTFTASRGVVMMASQDYNFKELVVEASSSVRYKNAANKLLDEKNYQRLHLLNSLLVLEKCDQNKQSVSLAKEIIYSYINENDYPDDHKLKYVYSIFKSIRTVSYMAYDLQIADTPVMIDICNEKAMILILKELLSEYNNNLSIRRFIKSVVKLLDDTVYNENSNAICYYKISKKMVDKLRKTEVLSNNYYQDYFLCKDSVFNKFYSQQRDYNETQILKLTFNKEEHFVASLLLNKLESVNNTRVGYYDRHSGEQTILVSIKKKCSNDAKITAAFKTMKIAINCLRRITNIKSTDVRFLLCVKFFLYYLFKENPVVIKATVDKEKCVICTRGKSTRVKEIQSLLNNFIENKDQANEIKFLLSRIEGDLINDTSITIPASILVYKKDSFGCNLCEFDGMIIHPMRKTKQIIFLEAKNTKSHPDYAKKCLKIKFDKLGIDYKQNDIRTIKHDAMMEYTI